MKGRRTPWLGALLAVLVLTALGVAFRNARGIDAVTVRFVGPGNEPSDRVLGLGGDESPPDYRLEVVHAGGKYRCGTILNRSAAEPLQFVVTDSIPVRQVRELVLSEDDKVEDDVIVRVQYAGERLSGGGYEFVVTTSRSVETAFAWFISTWIGKAISLGITVVVVLVLLSLLAGLLNG